MDDPLIRLQNLQRDLLAFSESRLPILDRLAAELDASTEDLKKLLDKKQKNEESRKQLAPAASSVSETLKIGDAEYNVTQDFRQAGLMVADELDLDEMDAARLCIDVVSADQTPTDPATLPFLAILRFQKQRELLLHCLQLLLEWADASDEESDLSSNLREVVANIVSTPGKQPPDFAAYWDKCIAGLTQIETAIRKVGEQKLLLENAPQLDHGNSRREALDASRILLARQHECLSAVMTYLLRGQYVQQQGFRSFLTKAASLDVTLDIAVHYLPILISGATTFGAGHGAASVDGLDLHKLFAAGPGQLQFKLPALKAAATVIWLAEYSARFADTTADPVLRVADRQKAEEERTTLFFEAIKDKAFHFLLAATSFLKPEIWHNPARIGLVNYLLLEAERVPNDAPPASPDFTKLAMTELQAFADAFISNLPDALRRLRIKEDEQRRDNYSRPQDDNKPYEPDLERFIVITSYAFQDDAEAAADFWSDREGNLYGFLRWISQRLPTPRVAAFCDLLTSIASDAKSANNAHRFLLEDTHMMTGKLRKSYSVSWGQIIAELNTFSASLKDRPAAPQNASPESFFSDIMEHETGIMLESYLRLISHLCKVSSDARNWLLREQPEQIAETLLQLVQYGIEPRIQACCFDMLSSMLTDKVPEVNDGMWVMLDSWIAGGGAPTSGTTPRSASKPAYSERHYLQRFNDNPETAASFVGLLNALVAIPPGEAELTLDTLPFPENLGAPVRHGGIDAYVDFAVGSAFRLSPVQLRNGYPQGYVDVLRCSALDFMLSCLSTFNEDLVVLANTTNVAVDTAIKTTSLAVYVRLHPCARVMEWLFNNNVIDVLASTAQSPEGDLNEMDSASPKVQSVLKAVQVMNLAFKLQSTYFDIVRPIIKMNAPSTGLAVANAAFASYDEVILSQLQAVVEIMSYTPSKHLDLSLESLELIRKLSSSRKLNDKSDLGSGGTHIRNRVVGLLNEVADSITAGLQSDFEVYEYDLDTTEEPARIVQATAVLDLLNQSLSAFGNVPSIAHCLLGFSCQERTVTAPPESTFYQGTSLFHVIVACAAQSPIAVPPNNISWLLKLKRGCLEVITKLASSSLTAALVRPQLRLMDFLAALSDNQLRASSCPEWDCKALGDPEVLLGGSAEAVRDFLHTRGLFFEYAALELRSVSDLRAISVQEKAVSALRGKILFPGGEVKETLSVFELLDFLELETAGPSDVFCKILQEVDFSTCVESDVDCEVVYDLKLAEQLLILRKRELINAGGLRDATEEQQVDDEIRATLASLKSKNNWLAIKSARVSALEGWTDLLSLMLTAGGLQQEERTLLALQALQVTLPKFERSLSENMESAAYLAKLTLALVPAAIPEPQTRLQETAITAYERLLMAFRVCLKTITDSASDVALRDVCYRICCSVIGCLPLTVVNGKTAASQNAKQLMQLVQTAGERLLTVITEDAFSGRGSTRVSAVLCLDALVVLYQSTRSNNALMRALSKLNFIPVLIDMSIGSVATAFQDGSDELVTTLAYFHTALALLLRICHSGEGTQLVLNSGIFEAIASSRLFSTDPDIGLDIDNPAALREFYRLLSAVLRVVTAIVMSKGPNNVATMQQAKGFLQQNRFSMQAVFKRTSAVKKTAGPPEQEAVDVADEFGKLMLVTGYLEDAEPEHGDVRVNGFT